MRPAPPPPDSQQPTRIEPGDTIWCGRVVVRLVMLQKDDGWAKFMGYVEDGHAGVIGREITVIGDVPNLKRGQVFGMALTYGIHEKWGEQYRINVATQALPVTTEGMIDYLKTIISGVGPKRAASIVAAFGEETASVLDSAAAVERLVREGGLPTKIAESIVIQWKEKRPDHGLLMSLRSCGISMSLAHRIQKHFGPETPRVVHFQPYRLLEVHGVKFESADAVALRAGVRPDDPHRLWAGVTYALLQEERNGHCWTPRPEAARLAARLLRQEEEMISEALGAEAPAGALVAVDALQDRVWLKRVLEAEVSLAENITALRMTPSLYREEVSALEWGRVWKMVEASSGISLSDEQQAAVRSLMENSVCVLTGGPGTGKSTVTRALLAALDIAGIRPVKLCAPTGKAARRLTEASGRDATTIHRMLEWTPCGPAYDDENPLDAAAVIVDEASMIDLTLASKLTAALTPGTLLIFVGDSNQLPSVGPGRVLADLIEAAVPHVALTTIFRQAEKSLITRAAYAINAGDSPVFGRKEEDDCFFVEALTDDEILGQVVTLVTERIPRRRKIISSDVRVLIPMHKGACGIEAVNRTLQGILNPPGRDKEECNWGDQILRERDKLIWRTNDYQLGLVNGEEVVVEEISVEPRKTMVTLVTEEGRFVKVGLLELEAVHSYALSVHKSQGSEYPCVIFVCHPFHKRMLNRRLVYTAVTRGRSLTILVGHRASLEAAVRTDNETHRRTDLVRRIRGESNVFCKLPAPKEARKPAAAA